MHAGNLHVNTSTGNGFSSRHWKKALANSCSKSCPSAANLLLYGNTWSKNRHIRPKTLISLHDAQKTKWEKAHVV